VTPDVFANNRLSSVLDTGKSVEELLARLAWSSMVRVNLLTTASPESKHVGTHGMASLIEHAYGLSTGSSTLFKFLMCFCSLDEGFKSSSYLTETLLDPEFGHASEANKSAFSKAFNVEVGLWSWLERPDNRLRLARFGAAMNGLKNVTPRDTIIGGSVMLQSFVNRHLTSKYQIGRVRLGKAPRGLTGCRRWRWRGRAVVDACHPFPTPLLRCPGP
jgi:hypothetical protein